LLGAVCAGLCPVINIAFLGEREYVGSEKV
jgi:hypothetical protein